jgi:rhamnogalacturonyl hydrolase YesR
LLDADAYPLPGVSGSAFFTYGFARGINNGILDRKKFQLVIERAWAWLLSHVYEDG